MGFEYRWFVCGFLVVFLVEFGGLQGGFRWWWFGGFGDGDGGGGDGDSTVMVVVVTVKAVVAVIGGIPAIGGQR